MKDIAVCNTSLIRHREYIKGNEARLSKERSPGSRPLLLTHGFDLTKIFLTIDDKQIMFLINSFSLFPCRHLLFF